MKILVCGAGVVGTLYAARQQARHTFTTGLASRSASRASFTGEEPVRPRWPMRSIRALFAGLVLL